MSKIRRRTVSSLFVYYRIVPTKRSINSTEQSIVTHVHSGKTLVVFAYGRNDASACWESVFRTPCPPAYSAVEQHRTPPFRNSVDSAVPTRRIIARIGILIFMFSRNTARTVFDVLTRRTSEWTEGKGEVEDYENYRCPDIFGKKKPNNTRFFDWVIVIVCVFFFNLRRSNKQSNSKRQTSRP